MANIKPYIDQIEQATYGEEVRSSFVNALVKVNEDNESYQALKEDVIAAKDLVEDAVVSFDTKVAQGKQVSTDLVSATSTANTAKSQLSTATSTANTARTNLSNTTDTANTAKTNLETATQAANTAKTNAETAKSNLDSSVSKANTAKTNVDASTSVANTAKTNLDASVKTAGVSKSNLDSSIGSANTTKTELDKTINDAGTARVNLSNTVTNAESKRSEIQGVISSGSVLKAALTEQNTEAANNIAEGKNVIADLKAQSNEVVKISAAEQKKITDLSTAEQAKVTAIADQITTDYGDMRSDIDNLDQLTDDIAECIGYNDVMGVEIDYQTGACRRLAGANGKTMGADFDAFYAGRKKCTLSDEGCVNHYYGDTGYKEDGSDGQVMIRQPQIYYKVIPIKLDPQTDGVGYHLRKARYYISTTPKAGFKLHPAFYDRNGREVDCIYLSAYEGSIYDTSASTYLLADEQVADFGSDKLCSISGAKPASGKTQLLTRANIERLAKNRGDGWHADTIKAESLEQLLMLVEFGSANTQTALGMGVTNIADSPNTDNNSVKTGATATLGNASGMADGTNGKVSISWRGKENPWGNIWKLVDGINIWGDGKLKGGVPYICADYNFAESKNNDNYVSAGFTVANANGYISAFGYSETSDWLFAPSETLGNSALPVGDYLYCTTNLDSYRIALLGGPWTDVGYAGGFYWILYAGSGHRSRSIGGRLIYVPTVTPDDPISYNDIEQVAFTETAKGDNIKLTDAADWRVLDVGITGKSEQTVTTGAQLFNPTLGDLNKYDAATGTLRQGSGTTNTISSGTKIHTYKNSAMVSQIYTATAGQDGLCTFIKDNTFDSIKIAFNGDKIDTFLRADISSLPDGNYTISYRSVSSAVNNGVISGIMLNAGSEAKPYEPYTGGKPSPNPDYPSQIQSPRKFDLMCCGKNLFDTDAWFDYYYAYKQDIFKETVDGRRCLKWRGGSGWLGSNYCYPIYIPAGKKITLSFYSKKESVTGKEDTGIKILDKNKNTLMYNAVPDTMTWTYTSKTAVLQEPAYLACMHYANNAYCYFADVQITIEDDTTYEPFTGQTIHLAQDRPITKWDKLVRQDGVWGWLHGGREVVFTGTEGWYQYGGDNIATRCFSLPTSDAVLGYQKSYCNMFTNTNEVFFDKFAGQYGIYCDHPTATNKYFRAPDESVVTVEQFKDWLAKRYADGNPVILQYQLATPEFIPLPQAQQDQLNTLRTHKGVTYITTTDPVRPAISVKYVKNPDAVLSDIKDYLGYTDNEILGLEVDLENKSFRRLDAAEHLSAGSDFDKWTMYGGRKRCTVADDGKINHYYGDTSYKEDGSDGQVMVYQPKFYYRVVPIKLDPQTDGVGYHLRKANYYISETPRTGFKLHPAFYDETGREVDFITMSAYEGCIYDTSAAAYLLDDSQVADFAADKLSSISGAKPASGKTQLLTRANMEQLAKNRGTGWHSDTIKAESAEQLLMMIEYGCLNLQDAIARGVVDIVDSPNTDNNSIKTGQTSGLGNASGMADGTNGKASISWRGKENPWGNVWKFVDGINIYGNGKLKGGVPYICTDYNFAESKNDANYISAGFTAANANGFISAFGYSETSDWMFISSEALGNSALPVGDYYYCATSLNGYRIAAFGGGWYHGGYVGGYCWSFSSTVGARDRAISGRLIYIPSAKEAQS